jgi:hypothetical protein
MASWVQAAGTIFALFVAIGIPFFQGRLELRQRRKALWSSIEYAVEQTRAAHLCINIEIDGSSILKLPRTHFRIADRLLRGAPVYQVDSSDAARLVANLRADLKRMEELCRRAQTQVPLDAYHVPNYNRFRDPIRSTAHSAEKHAKALRAALSISIAGISGTHKKIFPNGYGDSEGF